MPGAEVIAWIVMAFAAAAIFWFVLGALRNRNRASRELERLGPLLERLGTGRTGSWVAPGTLRITIERGRSAIARSTIVLLLEPREIGVLWLMNRWRGRRDLLILRSELRRPAATWTELFQARGRIGEEVRAALAKSGQPLTAERAFPSGLVALGEQGSEALSDRLWEIWAPSHAYLLRAAVKPNEPNLVVAISLADDVDWAAIAAAVTETADTIANEFARR